MISSIECAKRIMKIAGGLESAYEAHPDHVLEFIQVAVEELDVLFDDMLCVCDANDHVAMNTND